MTHQVCARSWAWHCSVIHGTGYCMGFALLSSPVLPKTGGGEKEMKKKNTPCLPLLFPFATSAVGCQLPESVSLHPLLSAVCPCQRCAGIKDWEIALKILGKMCKKWNMDGKSIPSTCRTLIYSVSEENHQSMLVCSQRSFTFLLQEYFYSILRF